MPVAGRIMRGVYGVVVLAQELGAFLLGQVPENNLRVIRVVNLDRLGGHAIQITPGPGHCPPGADSDRNLAAASRVATISRVRPP